MLDKILYEFALRQGYTLAELAAGQEAFNRKHRLSHPPGDFDKAGRFILHERGGCCDMIRAPSRSRPYPEMEHGRSLTHVAHLHGVPKLHLLRLVKAYETASTHEPLSSHQKMQVIVRLRSILKPVPERSRPAA